MCVVTAGAPSVRCFKLCSSLSLHCSCQASSGQRIIHVKRCSALDVKTYIQSLSLLLGGVEDSPWKEARTKEGQAWSLASGSLAEPGVLLPRRHAANNLD